MTRPLPGRRLALALAVLAWLPAAVATAAETQWWISDSAADYAKAEARGIVVRPDGVLELGPAASSSPADSLNVIWAVLPLADGSVALAGDRGRIDRWTERDGVRPWVKLPVGQVLSLATDGERILAGTGPEGRIYRIGARGDTALVALTGERYVWALAAGGKGVWYAATGTRGRLLRIEGIEVRTVLDSDEGNLVSLIPDGRGGVYAGGDSHGRVYHLPDRGRAATVFDAGEDEVRALALGAGGVLWAAALSGSAVTEDAGTGAETRGPSPVRSAVTGGRAVVYRIVPDSVAIKWWEASQPFVFAMLSGPGGVLAATGNRAAVFQLEASPGASQLLALPEGQVTALAAGRAGRVWAATSNPGALWSLGPAKAARGEILSPVNDARRLARFGRVRWRGTPDARVALHTRTGNTDPPDTTWSAWSGGGADREGRRVEGGAARYLQWKLTLEGPDARVESVEASWREQNLPPRVEDLVIAPQGQGFREGELTPRVESVTQVLPGGQKVEYSVPSASQPKALRELPMWARGLRTLQWKGVDPNGDVLRYRLDVRSEPEGPWMKVGEDLAATSFTWDTSTLPDGRHRLRVTVTDQPSNAIGEERTGEALSEPFTVDNTPPVIVRLDARGEAGSIQFEGRAEDAASPLSRLEASVDDGDWRPLTPEEGLVDAAQHSFRVRLPTIEPGEHSLSVRAVDLAGNSVIRATRVSVPRPR